MSGFGRDSVVVKVASWPVVSPSALTATRRKWYVVLGLRSCTAVVTSTAPVPAPAGRAPVWRP